MLEDASRVSMVLKSDTAGASPHWLYSSAMLHSENETIKYFDVHKQSLYELS
jgi:hypothetical protein